MPRRVSLPAADELFRTTGGNAVQPSAPAPHEQGGQPEAQPNARVPAPASETGAVEQANSGEHAAAEEEPDSSEADAADGSDHASVQEYGTRQNSRTSTERSAEPPAPRTSPEAGERRRSQAKKAESARAGGKDRQGAAAPATRRGGRAANRRPSGRERHDEKITVYVSAEELMDLEHARLVLRGEHGLAVDRGRVVREAVAVVLADLESRGEASILVRRLRSR